VLFRSDFFDRPRRHSELVEYTLKQDFGAAWEALLPEIQLDARRDEILRREVQRPNGVVLDILSVPLTTGGYVTTTTDVTERNRAAEAIRAARDQAEEATRVKSQFLANMSHEIRTPLSGISGFLELLDMSHLDATQRAYVKSASVAANALIGIIGDVLDFSKIEAGHIDVHRSDVDVLRAVLEVVSLLSPKATERGCGIAVQVASDAPRLLHTDPLRLKQVLMNITGNAIKFAQDGLIHIAVDPVEDPTIGPALRFMVTDTGIGFPREKAALLFNEFAQADSSTTRRFGGTGLGLAISRRLTELMGGRIDCLGEADFGAVFWFLLPAEPEAPTIGVGKVASGTRVGTVLLSDDAGALVEAVRHAGLEIEDLGANGLNRARRADHDVVLVVARSVEDALGQMTFAETTFAETPPRIRFLVADRDDFQARQRAFRAGFTHLLTHARANAVLPGTILSATMGATELDADADLSLDVEFPLDRIDPDVQGRPILLIDDLDMNRTIAGRQVESLGLAVDTAENGERGLAKATRGGYALILVDCSMPVMDGFEFTERFRAWEHETAATRHTPVIALTANATVGDAERCLAAGMDDYLAKPVTLARMAATLQRWLAGPRPIAADTRHARGRETRSAEAPPLDLALLSEIIGSDDRAMMASLLHSFEDAFEPLRAAMATALDTDDLETLREVSHAAKGAAANAGATALSDALHALETAADNGDRDGVQEIWSSVDAHRKAALGFIATLPHPHESRGQA